MAWWKKRYVHSDERLRFFGQLGQFLPDLVGFNQCAQPLENLLGLR
jgi:hypothetical protein